MATFATLPGNTVFAAGWDGGTLLRGSSAVPKGFNGSSGSPTIVSAPAGFVGVTNAARFSVDSSKYDGFGDRSEVQGSTNEVEGQSRWYAWEFLIPSTFPFYGGFQVCGQWHSALDGSPPIGFYLDGGTYLQLVFNLGNASNPVNSAGQRNIVQYGFCPWRMTVPRGVVTEICMAIVWSSSDTIGSHKLWVNGVRQTFNGPNGNGSQTFLKRNTDPGYSHYYKQGYYRQHSTTQPDPIIFHYAGFRSTDGAHTASPVFDGSTPPPPPPPTDTPTDPPDDTANRLGAGVATGNYNPMQADSIRGIADTIEVASTVTHYICYMKGLTGTATTQAVRACLYQVVDSNPLHDVLIPESISTPQILTGQAGGAWWFMDVPDFDIQPGTYRVCLISGATNNTIQYSYTTGFAGVYANDTYADGPAATFGGQTTVNGTFAGGIALYARINDATATGVTHTIATTIPMTMTVGSPTVTIGVDPTPPPAGTPPAMEDLIADVQSYLNDALDALDVARATTTRSDDPAAAGRAILAQQVLTEILRAQSLSLRLSD